MTTVDPVSLSGIIGWSLLHLLWQGAGIAAILSVVLFLLRGGSANARYLVACASLLLMVMLPIGNALWLAGAESPATIASVPRPIPLLAETPEPAALVPIGPSSTVVEQQVSADEIAAQQPKVASNVPTSPRTLRTMRALLNDNIVVLVWVWACGVALLAMRLFGGWVLLRRTYSRSNLLAGAEIEEAFIRLAAALQVRHRVRIFLSPTGAVPITFGSIKPIILFPASLLTGLPSAEIEALLAHELAHIRRHDYVVNLFQSVAETLLYYHPAVWWISSRIRAERELCCDEMAASACTGGATSLACALARMEEQRSGHGELALAASGSPLIGRIRRLLRNTVNSPRPTGRPAGALILLLVGVVGLTLVVYGGWAQFLPLSGKATSATSVGQAPLPSSSTSKDVPGLEGMTNVPVVGADGTVANGESISKTLRVEGELTYRNLTMRITRINENNVNDRNDDSVEMVVRTANSSEDRTIKEFRSEFFDEFELNIIEVTPSSTPGEGTVHIGVRYNPAGRGNLPGLAIPQVVSRVFELRSGEADTSSSAAAAQVVEQVRKLLGVAADNQGSALARGRFWYDDEAGVLTVVDDPTRLEKVANYLARPRVRAALGQEDPNTTAIERLLKPGQTMRFGDVALRLESVQLIAEPTNSYCAEVLVRTGKMAEVRAITDTESIQVKDCTISLVEATADPSTSNSSVRLEMRMPRQVATISSIPSLAGASNYASLSAAYSDRQKATMYREFQALLASGSHDAALEKLQAIARIAPADPQLPAMRHRLAAVEGKTGFQVRVGSGLAKEAANSLAEQLKREGYQPVSSVVGQSGRYDVMCGYGRNEREADLLMKDLKAAGFTPEGVLGPGFNPGMLPSIPAGPDGNPIPVIAQP